MYLCSSSSQTTVHICCKEGNGFRRNSLYDLVAMVVLPVRNTAIRRYLFAPGPCYRLTPSSYPQLSCRHQTIQICAISAPMSHKAQTDVENSFELAVSEGPPLTYNAWQPIWPAPKPRRSRGCHLLAAPLKRAKRPGILI